MDWRSPAPYLAVLELRKGNVDQARSNFTTASELADHMFEPFFNAALLSFKMGDFQESYDLAQKVSKQWWHRSSFPSQVFVTHSSDRLTQIINVLRFLTGRIDIPHWGFWGERLVEPLYQKALGAYPEHSDSLDLLKQIKQHFTSL